MIVEPYYLYGYLVKSRIYDETCEYQRGLNIAKWACERCDLNDEEEAGLHDEFLELIEQLTEKLPLEYVDRQEYLQRTGQLEDKDELNKRHDSDSSYDENMMDEMIAEINAGLTEEEKAECYRLAQQMQMPGEKKVQKDKEKTEPFDSFLEELD